MKKIITLLCSVVLLSINAQSQYIYFKGILQGSQEVPANASAATGVVIVKYDTSSNILMLMGNFTGLSAAATAAHIHSPAAPGSNANVIVPLTLTGDTTGSLSVTDTLTDTQEMELMDGLMYVNVHNAIYAGGEIRAQLTQATAGQSTFFSARLQGAQQVPPNSSGGTGSAYVLADNGTDSVFLTGNFTGLSAPATMAHIHNEGLPGVNGPVLIPLVVSLATQGTIHVAAAASDAAISQMTEGSTYVNIHNATYPGGEIRGQLTMLSETYFLKAVLQGSQEVPANGSAGTGTVIVKYNSNTNILELTGNYQNASAAVTASHIHGPAAPGTNADVITPVVNTAGNRVR